MLIKVTVPHIYIAEKCTIAFSMKQICIMTTEKVLKNFILKKRERIKNNKNTKNSIEVWNKVTIMNSCFVMYS